jgi:hypothetical protein
MLVRYKIYISYFSVFAASATLQLRCQLPVYLDIDINILHYNRIHYMVQICGGSCDSSGLGVPCLANKNNDSEI